MCVYVLMLDICTECCVCVFVYVCVICMWEVCVFMYVCVMFALECVYGGCAHVEDTGTGVCLRMWSVCMCDVCTGVCG